MADGDKANTANSEVTLELREGDPEGHFTMADRKRGTITLAKPLDYDAGPDTFLLGVVAKVSGRGRVGRGVGRRGGKVGGWVGEEGE